MSDNPLYLDPYGERPCSDPFKRERSTHDNA